MSPKVPKLIVFDLDCTLWPFHVDTYVQPPFHLSNNGQIKDLNGQKIKCYEDIPEILERLQKDGYILGVASRTGEINGANQLLSLWNWNKYFTHKEIYPGCKNMHFQKIKKNSGVDFKDMMFFDDEVRNIRDINKIGVFTILVRNGVTKKLIATALQEFSECN